MNDELLVKPTSIDTHSNGIENIAKDLEKFQNKLSNMKSTFNGGTPLDNSIIQSIIKLTNKTDNIISNLNLSAQKNKNFIERIESFENTHSTEITSDQETTNSICDYKNENRYKYDGMSIIEILNSLDKNEKMYVLFENKNRDKENIKIQITKENYKEYIGKTGYRVYIDENSGINGTTGSNISLPGLKAIKQSELDEGYCFLGGKLESANDLIYPMSTPEYIIKDDGTLKKVDIQMKFNGKTIGKYPISGGKHTGDDLHAFMVSSGTQTKVTDKTPVNSIAPGIVLYTENTTSTEGFGTQVVVLSQVGKDYVLTTYGHLTAGSINVKPGDTVTNETIIANVGNTGNSSGPHLHLETEIIKKDSLSSANKQALDAIEKKYIQGENITEKDTKAIFDPEYTRNESSKAFKRHSNKYELNAKDYNGYEDFAKKTYLINQCAECKEEERKSC